MKILKIIGNLFSSDRAPKEVLAIMQKIRGIAYPRGEEQIAEEAEMLHAVLEKRVSIEDLKRIIAVTKPMFFQYNSSPKVEIEMVDDFIFKKQSKNGISSSDICTINEFYASYFRLVPRLPQSAFKKYSVANEVNLYDETENYWGTVFFDREPNFELTKDGKERFYQAVLLPSVLAARKNLSKESMNMFSRLVGLPEEDWSEMHYRQFAFGFSNWMSDPSGDDFGNLGVRKIKDSVGGFRVPQTGPYNDKNILELYKLCLINVQ